MGAERPLLPLGSFFYFFSLSTRFLRLQRVSGSDARGSIRPFAGRFDVRIFVSDEP